MTETQVRQPQVINCKEYGKVEDLDTALFLSPDGKTLALDSDVDGRNAFTVEFHRGQIRLRASSLVGAIPLNEHVVLRVSPRFPVANLTRMVLETDHHPQILQAFRSYESAGTATEWVMSLYAQTLLDHIDLILSRGMHKSYEQQQGEGTFPHGRINFSRTARRFAARGVNHKAVHEWFERTTDTPLNRCLKAALMVVHTRAAEGPMRRGDRDIVARTAGQLRAFEDVADDPGWLFMTDRYVSKSHPLPGTRAYYSPAVSVALMILRNSGIRLELGGESLALPSLLIDMNTLFESYVRRVLQRHAEQAGWAAEVLDGNADGMVPLYERPEQLPQHQGVPLEPAFPGQGADATPDIVFRMPDGTTVLVGEVKNTAKGGKLPDRVEINQAVTYAVRYGLTKTLVVRPFKSAGEPGLGYCGRVGGVDVYDYKVDLGNADLDAVVSDYVAAVASLLPHAATSSAA